MAKPISVQLYSARDRLAADRGAALRRIAELGYTAVEPYNPTDEPEALRALIDELGLSVSGVHASGLLRLEPARVLDAVAALGGDLAILPAGFEHGEFTTRDGLSRIADTLNALAGQAAEHGLRFAYHNHWWELEPLIDAEHALDVLAGLLAPDVFLEVDTYWAAVGGADVPALLRRLGDRVVALHVKDGPVVKDEPHTALGKGAMPIEDILAASPGATRVVELDTCATDIFDALGESRAYLAGLERP